MNEDEQQISLKSLFTPLTTFKVIHFIVVIGIVVFINMLLNDFVWDDKTFILLNQDVHTINIPFLFGRNSFNMVNQYRPIPAIYFALLYSLFSTYTFFYHLLQLSFHIANTVLLFILFKFFFGKKVSFFLSLVFLIHPMQVESVSYIAQTPVVLSSLFGFTALILSCKTKLTPKTTIITFILLLLSLLTKESGVIFIIQLLLWKFLYQKRDFWRYGVYSFITGAVYLFLRLVVGKVTPYTSSVVPIDTVSFLQRLVNIPAIVFYYLKTFIYPRQLVIDQVWIVKSINTQSFYLPLFWVSLFFIFLPGVGIYLFKNKLNLFKTYLFFIVWFIGGLVPFLQLYPIDGTVADRWFYVPMVGLLGVIGVLLRVVPLKRFKGIGIILAVILILLFSLRTSVRNTNWVNAITLNEHDSQILDNYNIEANLSTELKNEGRIDDSIKHMQKSVALLPYEVNLANLGTLYEQQGKVNLARLYYLRALNAKSHWYPLHRHDSSVYINAISFLLRQNDLKNANQYEMLAIHDYPDSQPIWLLAAFLQEALGNHENAITAAQQANQLRPTSYSQQVLFNLIANKSIKGLL